MRTNRHILERFREFETRHLRETPKTRGHIFRERNTKAARQIPKALWRVVQRKLKMLDVAARVDNLDAPPGNRLKRLKGALKGRHSIRVNGTKLCWASAASQRTRCSGSRVCLKTSPQFWMRLQADWDLHQSGGSVRLCRSASFGPGECCTFLLA